MDTARKTVPWKAPFISVTQRETTCDTGQGINCCCYTKVCRCDDSRMYQTSLSSPSSAAAALPPLATTITTTTTTTTIIIIIIIVIIIISINIIATPKLT
ncbi:hypothetical protein PoB_004158300 [Plakobranchus ocellatus]|uniref:Uncharacterized protein n=1 Tax=Plakobranchus ocellatus TaxID=259542 RepID=A0AAV4B7F0_9GAST|nr:hypothetical protein PoB_004158300 [Plakobranchus ocellatus]